MGTSARQPLVLVETSNLPREEWLAYSWEAAPFYCAVKLRRPGRFAPQCLWTISGQMPRAMSCSTGYPTPEGDGHGREKASRPVYRAVQSG